MKKIVLSISIIIAIVACNQKPKGFTINGNLRGEVENGTQVFLRAVGENNQPVDVDTAKVENGKFTFTGSAETPELNYVFIDKLPGYTAVILENGEIDFKAQKDSLGFAEIGGTAQNETFADYMDKSKELTLQAQSIQQDMQQATVKKDTATAKSLQDEMMELQDKYKNFELDYIKSHPDALISALLIDRALGTGSVTAEEAQAMYEELSPEIKKTKVAVAIQERLEGQKQAEANAKNTTIGAIAPDFTAPTPDGKDLALNDALGKVTLVDFWAAWCKPCRAENPNVVSVYEKYHDKGLNILGVSLDRTAEAWKKAIEDDGLTWQHVSHVAYFNDPIAKLYNVDAIPAAFLLDENGVIVAKNLRGPALEAKVAELLN
ncbi:Peroxiredoxin [Pricia antarctica]|uniref:Peroxiredoxin n=1 Tax=Pricia antarctica TaxID=641691 RepID=A0A1G7BME9_9FLAO|nr:TlpA disulfide reductase family protein [Pricia antarctica]SDE27415.1 Peroxiredoxin [Pricia antarctica]